MSCTESVLDGRRPWPVVFLKSSSSFCWKSTNEKVVLTVGMHGILPSSCTRYLGVDLLDNDCLTNGIVALDQNDERQEGNNLQAKAFLITT
ncbi:hypothetical protein BHE74_00031757 [Ensete ventricosum]|nr:hypothetical protein BHE74_00031757 [Ensete ventricosum]